MNISANLSTAAVFLGLGGCAGSVANRPAMEVARDHIQRTEYNPCRNSPPTMAMAGPLVTVYAVPSRSGTLTNYEGISPETHQDGTFEDFASFTYASYSQLVRSDWSRVGGGSVFFTPAYRPSIRANLPILDDLCRGLGVCRELNLDIQGTGAFAVIVGEMDSGTPYELCRVTPHVRVVRFDGDWLHTQSSN